MSSELSCETDRASEEKKNNFILHNNPKLSLSLIIALPQFTWLSFTRFSWSTEFFSFFLFTRSCAWERDANSPRRENDWSTFNWMKRRQKVSRDTFNEKMSESSQRRGWWKMRKYMRFACACASAQRNRIICHSSREVNWMCIKYLSRDLKKKKRNERKINVLVT